VCILSKVSTRLIRYAFTYIGLYLYKHLLGQLKELKEVMIPLQKKAKNEKDESRDKTLSQIKILKESVNIIKACNETLFTHLVMKRSQDVQELVRKSVFEWMA
jgi:hypothetical protein